MRHNRAISVLAGATILAAGTAVLLPMTAQAAPASVACNETALVTAVTAANAAGGEPSEWVMPRSGR